MADRGGGVLRYLHGPFPTMQDRNQAWGELHLGRPCSCQQCEQKGEARPLQLPDTPIKVRGRENLPWDDRSHWIGERLG